MRSSSSAHGSKRVFILAIQAPFAEPTRKYLTEMLTPKGVTVAGSLIYDKDKTTYRSEVDQALRAKPDLLYLNGYAPDSRWCCATCIAPATTATGSASPMR